MNEKTIRALLEASAVRAARIVARGQLLYVEISTAAGWRTAETNAGKPKTWRSIDSAAKWLRNLGIGTAQLSIGDWQPGQREL